MPTVRHYLEGRLFEWCMATAMILLALQTFVWPRTLGSSAFHLLTEAIPTSLIGFFLLMFGALRFAALIANGRSLMYGPGARAVGAVAGAIMWAQFELALLGDITFNNPPSPGIPFWFTFILAEIYTVYRAVSDVGGS